MLSDNIPAPAAAANYRPNEIVLYGVKLNDTADHADIPFDDTLVVGKGPVALRLQVQARNAAAGAKPIGSKDVVLAVIYGYAYEGACYRFDRPRLYAFAPDAAEAPAEGCGFDASYKMWRITSKSIMFEVATNTGEADDLVLKANLPGNRAPNTYGNNMQMAHRGGKLNRADG